MKVPAAVLSIIEKLNRQGFEAYLVGGAVRALILQEDCQDYDVATSANFKELTLIFPKASVLSQKCSVIKLEEAGLEIEIASFRQEANYLDQRRPSQVKIIRDKYEDLKRRDFSINAIFYHPQEGFIDPYQGRQDIQAKLLRTIKDAESSFQEDSLRIMRALRFSYCLGFVLEAKCKKAAYQQSSLVKQIPRERLAIELRKVLICMEGQALFTLIGNPILEEIWGKASSLPAQNIKTDLVKIAGLALCHEEASLVLSSFCLSKQEQKNLQIIISNHPLGPATLYEARKILGQLGPQVLAWLLELETSSIRQDWLKLIAEIEIRQDPLSLSDLALSGADLIELGLEPGPVIKSTLALLLDLVLRDKVPNQRSYLLEKAKEIKGSLPDFKQK